VGPGGRVWAVDADRDRLVRLKNMAEMEGRENVEIVRGNVERRLGSLLPEGGIDMVIIANALFAATDKDGVIEEAWRVLKPGGRLLVVDWKDGSGLGPDEELVVPRDAGLRMLVRGGFERVDDLPAGDYHWGILMRKKAQ
jgi:ubiquinone/menaquinone biosynthesis C-methylase UbiE